MTKTFEQFIEWHSVKASLPEKKKLVMVCGLNPFKNLAGAHPQFLVTAYYDAAPVRHSLIVPIWYDVSGYAIREDGWVPEFWAELMELPR